MKHLQPIKIERLLILLNKLDNSHGITKETIKTIRTPRYGWQLKKCLDSGLSNKRKTTIWLKI